jgi:hypothetical protein
MKTGTIEDLLTWSVPTVTGASPTRGPVTPSTPQRRHQTSPRRPPLFRNDKSVVQERVGGHTYSEEEFPVLEDTSSPMSTRADKRKTTKFNNFIQ